MDNIMRYQFADYLDVNGVNGSEEDYHLMNTGFTSLGENPNTQEETKQYVGDKASSSKITGYQTEFPYEAELIKDEKCTNALFDTVRNQKTGAAAQFNYVRVELWNPSSTEEGTTTYKARKFKVTNVPDELGAEPGAETISGSLKQNGDFVDGTFNVSTLTFTANV